MSNKSIKTLISVIKPIIALFLATVLLTQILTVVQSGGSGGNMLQFASAQSASQTQDSGFVIKEIEKVTKDLGYSISPNSVPTSISLPLEFGTRPGGTLQAVVPGASGVVAVRVWENEGEAQAFSKERTDLLTKGSQPILLDNVVLIKGKDGAVWYFVGGAVQYGPLVNSNKFEIGGSATGEFVCGKVTLSADETIISDPIDMPAGGIKGPDALRGGGENQNYKNMKAEGDNISKKASEDLAQRLQNIVAALVSKGLCTGVPQPQQQVDHTCPVENRLENVPVSSRPASGLQNNIKLAAYTPGDSNSYKDRDIINVQASGAPTTATSSGCGLPIIFIPGIGGSELKKGSTVIWPYSTGIGESDRDLPELDLLDTGKQKTNDIKVGDILRTLILGGDFYGEFVKSILQVEYKNGEKYQEGKSLFIFPYDWRLDNSDHVKALGNKVDDVIKYTKSPQVILITHSMGGLIATAYISNPLNAKKIDTLITIAAPYFGAPKPFYALTMGYNFDNPTVAAESFKISAQNWPSVYQLLPRTDFVKDQTYGVESTRFVSNNDVYGDKTLYKSLKRTNPGKPEYSYGGHDWSLSSSSKMLPIARSFWKDLPSIDTTLSSNVKHYVIVGTGVQTLTEFKIEEMQGYDVKYAMPMLDRPVRLVPKFKDGDGQVPLETAIPKGVTAVYYVPYIREQTISKNGVLNDEPIDSTHGWLPSNKFVQSIVGLIISGKPSEAGSAQGYVDKSNNALSFTSPVTMNSKGELINPDKKISSPELHYTIQSDVLTTITDERNEGVLGYNENGQIVESLPGSFLSMDGAEYASLGDLSRTYKASLIGIRDGNFTLGINITKDDQEKSISFSYVQVPVKKGTVAELTMTPNKVTASSIPILKVNNDGTITDVAATVGPVSATGNASTSAASGAGVGTVQDGFLTYDNSDYGFKITYPQDWKAEKGKGKYQHSPYIEVVKFSPSDSQYASVLVIIDPDRDTPIPDLLANSINEYNNHDTLKNVNVVESNTEALLAGKRAYELVFTDSTNGVEHKNKEVGSTIDGKAFYVSFFSEAANYDKYLAFVEQMFDSFELVGTGDGSDGNGSQTQSTTTGTTSTGTTMTSPIDTTNKTTTTTLGTGQQQQQQQQQASQQNNQGVLPVLLVHGWSSNIQDWTPWENLLQQDGIPYYPITFQESDDSCGTSQDHGNELGKKVEQIKQDTGKDQVNIVGYSKGGLDARAYVAQSGTDDVSNLIMIGTPNAGTPAATLVEYCTPGLYDLRPGASATMVSRNPNVNYYTIAGDWSSPSGGNPLIEGADDQLVPVASVESEQYFKSLGRTSHAHTELIGQEEYNLARPILGGTGGETIVDTDPAEPPTSSTGQQQQQQQPPSPQAVLISDDFDSENNGKGELQYRTFRNWIPKEGTVDLIGNGFYDIPGGKGLYVDLDGANLDAGILESKEEFSLRPGNYVLEFDISGPYFQGDANDVKVQLGNAFTETFTKEGVAPFEHIVRTIVVSEPTTAKLSFDHSGGDNIGLKLDNVKLYKSETDGTPTTTTTTATSDGGGPRPSPGGEQPSSSQQQQQGQQQQLSKPAKADMVDYENPDFRLAMKYPSNWAVQENPDYVVFTSPAENEADTSVESLYVYPLGDIPLGNSEEETLKSNIEATIDYREPYSDFQLLSSNNIEFNGKTAGQLEYTYTDTNIGSTKAKEIIAIDGNDRYDIIFMANADQYASILPTAQEIIDSIEITPSEQDNDEPTTTDQVINTTGDDDSDDDSDDVSGDGTKIDAGGETIVDTFDDPAVTDGGQGGEGGDNTQNGVDDNASLLPSDFKDYSNSGFQLSMKYPSDWTVQENPDQVTFVSPSSSQSDQYLESLAIDFVGNLQLFETEQETLEKNVETVTEHRKATLTGFEIQDSQDIAVLGLPAHKLVYTMDDVNIGPAKATEIILINGNNRYDILFIANLDQYDSVLPVAEEMIYSILLTPDNEASG